MAKKKKKTKKKKNVSQAEVKKTEATQKKERAIILASDLKKYSQAGQFLTRRGVETVVLSSLPESIKAITEGRPQFAFISYNLKNANIKKMEKLFRTTFNIESIVFAESGDSVTAAKLSKEGFKYTMRAPVSGPGMYMQIQKIHRERTMAEKQTGKPNFNRNTVTQKKKPFVVSTSDFDPSLDGEWSQVGGSGRNANWQLQNSSKPTTYGNESGVYNFQGEKPPEKTANGWDFPEGGELQFQPNEQENPSQSGMMNFQSGSGSENKSGPAYVPDEIKSQVGYKKHQEQGSSNSSPQFSKDGSGDPGGDAGREFEMAQERAFNSNSTDQGFDEESELKSGEGAEFSPAESESEEDTVEKKEENANGFQAEQESLESKEFGAREGSGNSNEFSTQGEEPPQEEKSASGSGQNSPEFSASENEDPTLAAELSPSVSEVEPSSQEESEGSGEGELSTMDNEEDSHSGEFSKSEEEGDPQDKGEASEKKNSSDIEKNEAEEENPSKPSVQFKKSETGAPEEEKKKELSEGLRATLEKEFSHNESVDQISESYFVERVFAVGIESPEVNGVMIFGKGTNTSIEPNLIQSLKKGMLSSFENTSEIQIYDCELNIDKFDLKSWATEKADFFIEARDGDYPVICAFISTAEASGKITSTNNEGMFEIPTAALNIEVPVSFNVFLHFKKNKKYIRYVRKGDCIQDTQRTHLIDCNVDSVYIKKDSYINYKSYILTCYMLVKLGNSYGTLDEKHVAA